jgi:predicted DNA-binding transcriptional regulator AlpA
MMGKLTCAGKEAQAMSGLGMNKVLSRRQTSEMLGLSLRTFARLEYAGDVPPRIKLSTRRVGYRLSEVRAWIDAREAPGKHPRAAEPSLGDISWRHS